MGSNELPTKPGVYWCTTYAARKALEVHYNGIELVADTRCGGQATPIRLMTDAQWLRIPGPDKLMEMQRKADQWDALGRSAEQPAADLAGYPVDVVDGMARFVADQRSPDPEAAAILEECQSELLGETVDEDALARLHERGRKAWADVPDATAWVEAERGHEPADPWITLYRECIKREDVPKWAKWVCVWARGGGVSWASSDPDEYGMCTTGRMTTRGGLDAMPPGGLDSLRRVADVWPEGGE